MFLYVSLINLLVVFTPGPQIFYWKVTIVGYTTCDATNNVHTICILNGYFSIVTKVATQKPPNSEAQVQKQSLLQYM